MTSLQLNLLVLRSTNLPQLLTFYQTLGLTFTPEQHADGPLHYSTTQGSFTIELYPTKTSTHPTDMIEFAVPNLPKLLTKIPPQYIHKPIFNTDQGPSAILKDPDGRKIYITHHHQS